MPSKSKTKGKTFERDIANYLGALYNDSFTRVPDSGAFTGGKNAHRRETLTENQVRAHKGDIIPPDHWRVFNCECKNYGQFPFHRLLYDAPVPLLEEWLQQLMDAADPGDMNILFFKVTRIGKFVAFEQHQPFGTVRHIDYCDSSGRNWCITEFDSFFALNTEAFEQASIG